MNTDIREVKRLDNMLKVISNDLRGVWHIYLNFAYNRGVIMTFCKYINGVPCFQEQAFISNDDWENNKIKFEVLAYMSEV